MRLSARCLSIATCIAAFSAPALAEQVDNPAYTAWAKYKPGTTVSYKTATSIVIPSMPEPRQNESRVTQKLIAVKPDAVTVEVIATMSMNGQDRSMPARQHDIPAKVEKGREGLPEAPIGGTAPDVKDVTEGKGTVDVKGKSMDATTREFTIELTTPRQMTMKVKMWLIPDVPGGMARSESHGTGSMTVDATTTLVDYTIAN